MTSMFSKQTMISNNIRPRYNKNYSDPAVITGQLNPMQHYRKGYVQTPYQKTSNQVTSSMVTNIMDAPGQVQQNTCQGISAKQNIYESSTGSNSYTINKSLQLLRGRPKMAKNYSQNYYQYLQKRCRTYDQCNFNFALDSNPIDKPGSPITLTNTYLANCLYNGETPAFKQCRVVVYKPNNYKFAKQGAVSSWLRTSQLADQTIATDAYLQQFCVKS